MSETTTVNDLPEKSTDAKESKLVIDWRDDIKNKNTARNYSYEFAKFRAETKLAAFDIVHVKTDDELKSAVKEWIREMKRRADNYGGKTSLERRGKLSVNSIGVRISAVKSFFDYYEKSVPWKTYQKNLPDLVTNYLRAYKKDEIRNMLIHADIRDRVAIFLMVSSGIRVTGLVQLKVGNIIRLPKEETGLQYEIGIIIVYADSKKYRYVSFISPEAIDAMDKYIAYRRDQGEQVTPQSPLIRNMFYPKVALEKHDKKTERLLRSRWSIEEAKPVDSQTIRERMKILIASAKVKDTDNLQPDHGFRKFFNTTAKNNGIDHMFKEMFMGHSIKLDGTYYDIEVPESRAKLVSEYRKAINALTISEEFMILEEHRALKEKVKDMPKLEVMQTMLIQKDVEFENYKKKMEEDRQRDKNELKEEMRKEMEKLVVDRYVEGKAYNPAGDKASPTPPAAAVE